MPLISVCRVTTPMLPTTPVRGRVMWSACEASAYPADSACSATKAWMGFASRAARMRSARSKAPATSPPKLSISSAMPRTAGSASAASIWAVIPS